MRIALFGGTFNPVHNGHLLIAEAARENYRLDRVVFVPAGLPPHKKAPRTLPKHRLAMLKLALRGHSDFTMSDWEVRQKRVVYTYETLEHFRRLWPKAALFFILGSDSLKNRSRWVRAERLPSLCHWIAMDRILPYASHEIRRRIQKGRSIRFLVPETVERYIRAHRLYRKPE